MTISSGNDPRAALLPDTLTPQVELPRSGIPTWLIAAIGAVLAISLFLLLEGRRITQAKTGAVPGQQIVLADPPPPLSIPRPAPQFIGSAEAPRMAKLEQPVKVQAVPQDIFNSSTPVFRPVQRPLADDVYAPPRYRTDIPATAPSGSASGAMVVDLTNGKGATVNGSSDPVADSDDAVRATIIRNRSAVVQQGVIIAAVLETPLNSDRTGLARAIVSNDVRSFDGSRVLIPRGSRLIGDFKADNNPGMRRILVTWSRLIRPDGVAIRIDSPSSDALGGAGVPGSVNTHFFERFAGSVLQSALAIGVNVASQIPNNGSNIYVGLPGQATQLGQDLLPDTKRAPTIKVKAGAQIAIFVAHDLDFGGTLAVR